jgi:lipopolysaccharide biosynthesis regulator YciM
MIELLWLLLPVAAASGWYAASRESNRRAKRLSSISSDYFKGLNYLINEQPDKAIEVFIKMVEVDEDTLETHMALGYLFRRRGEVDRAIRIHQNLLARQNLDSELRTLALLELGEDYTKAGLFDRAESLFQELIDMNELVGPSLKHLRDIYQQEKDWEKAIDTCERIEKVTGEPMNSIIAQYYCEIVENLIQQNNMKIAGDIVKKALKHDASCVRASMLRAKIEQYNEDYESAIEAYKHVLEQDVDYFPEIIEPFIDCYRKIGKLPEFMDFLHQVLERYDGVSPTLALAGLIREFNNDREAMEFVIEQLRKRPSVRGLNWLIDLSLQHSKGEAQKNLMILYDLTEKLLANKPKYICKVCGFSGKILHWQCPSCHSWNTVKPIHGVVGE